MKTPKTPSNVPIKFCQKSGEETIPVFDVVPQGKFFYMPRQDGTRITGCHLIFKCPVCRQINAHGGEHGKKGAGDGHRCSHCNCWPRGYYLREVELDPFQ